jgi:hypothetical protein
VKNVVVADGVETEEVRVVRAAAEVLRRDTMAGEESTGDHSPGVTRIVHCDPASIRVFGAHILDELHQLGRSHTPVLAEATAAASEVESAENLLHLA